MAERPRALLRVAPRRGRARRVGEGPLRGARRRPRAAAHLSGHRHQPGRVGPGRLRGGRAPALRVGPSSFIGRPMKPVPGRRSFIVQGRALSAGRRNSR
ncbi:MAG: hypothetical protein EPN43_02530, partial [Jatrophihabitans sp.]